MVWILWGLVLHAGPEMHPCYLGQLCPLMDKVHFDSTLKNQEDKLVMVDVCKLIIEVNRI